MKGLSIQSLKRRIELIEQEGFIEKCWIAKYTPKGTSKGVKSYWHLRSKHPIFNGKKSRHVKAGEFEHFNHLVRNAQILKKLRREFSRRKTKPSSGSREALTRSESNEWYTPVEYIKAVRHVMKDIDLDPASATIPQQWIQAKQFYDVTENGLKKPWYGRVWLNPPYGTHSSLWIKKAIETYISGDIQQAILLLKPAVGSQWYQSIASRFPECRAHKRIRFIDKNGIEQTSPPHGNSFFYLGPNITTFHAVFSTFGNISVPFKSLKVGDNTS